MAIKAAIFDLAGVVFVFDEEAAGVILGPHIAFSVAELSRLWDQWLLNDGSKIEDRTQLLRGFWDYFGARFEVPELALNGVREVPIHRFVRPAPDARSAIELAKRHGLKVGVLSNSPPTDTSKLLGYAGIADLIDSTCTPHTSGVAKPQPSAYLAIAASLGVHAEECVFFDDEEANVSGAVAVGMRAYLVDRRRASHALEKNVVNALTAISDILEGNEALTQ